MPLARPGDLLQDNQNNSYRIDKYLGEGVTAEVYKATRVDNSEVVAFKILRPSLPAEIIQSFRDEAVILGELVQYSWQRYPDELLHIPRVLGRSKERETLEFLVMEFVTGQPLDELIVTTQGLITTGREAEALRIARQVLQVLVVLHEDIRRSYVDFQLKNIWWLPEQSLAKVMDWNHVSKRAAEGAVPPDAVNDLIRFGAYLYQLLTGSGAFQTGESEGELAKRAGDKWQRISLGTRTILLKSLHPNPQNRYQTAREFLADIETMLTMWQQDEDDLYDDANLALRQAKSRSSQSGSDQYTVAQYADAVFTASRAINLFILRSRETRRVDRMREELEGLTASVSPVWGVGKNYYQLGVYSEALKQWEPEARNMKRLDLWRWVMVAQISRQKASALKEDYAPIKALLEEAITHLHEKEWSQAKEALKQIHDKGVSGPEVYAFGYEAEAQSLVKQARDAKNLAQWADASQSYTEAAQALRRIQDSTYLELLSSELSTPEQLDEEADLCRQHDQGYEKESQAINEFRLCMAQNNQPVAYLTKQLLQNPTQTRLLNVVMEEAEKEECPPELAIQLLSAAVFYGRAPSIIYERLNEKRHIQQQITLQREIEQYNNLLEQEQAEKHQEWLAKQTELLQQALQANQWETLYTIVSDMGGDVPSEARQTILDTFNTARKERNWPLILTLGDALSLIHGGAERAEIQQRMVDAKLYQELDLQLAQFNQQLLLKNFAPARSLLNEMQEQINKVHDPREQGLRQRDLDAKRRQLDQLEIDTVQEISVDQFIAALNRNGLQELSMKIENSLQSIEKSTQSLEEELETVASKNEELEKRNQQLSNQLKGTKGKGDGWTMAVVLFLLMILLLMGGGYFLKATQIDPLATQVAELPTAVANSQATIVAQNATQIASMEELSLTVNSVMQTQAAITPVPATALTTVVAETEVPIDTPTPAPPPLGGNLQVTSIPAPTRSFTITQEDGAQISPLELGGTISGGDIDTVFDWPSFDLTLSNGWFFDISGESVMMRHEGQAGPLPLQIQMTANSLTETMSLDVPVMSSWVLSPTGEALLATISIAGNSLKDEQLLPGRYDVSWLLPTSQELLHTQSITYTPTITVTWLTGSPLRERPEWNETYDINNDELGIAEPEVIMNVHGYACSVDPSNENLFMFLAVTLNNDPEKIYWLRNNITKEFATEQSDFQALSNAFDGVGDCVNEAQNVVTIVTTVVPTVVPTIEPTAEATAYP
jgi:serine/threonine-protein kinase